MKCARRPVGAHSPASPAPARSPASPTPAGSSRPDPRRGRCGARLFRLLPALALLLGALGLFAPAPAQAQTVLVKNLAQTTQSGAALLTAGYVVAQGFTTGSQTGGYGLGSITVTIGATPTSAQRDTIRAELWSATTGGAPNAKVASLTVPAHPIAAGGVSFEAPASTTLSASTTYFIVLYTTGNFSLQLRQTASLNEDSGGATGWSIGDKPYFATGQTPGGTWTPTSFSRPAKIGVYAAQTATTPAGTVWSATLTPVSDTVGNLGCDGSLAGLVTGISCTPSQALTDNDFSVGGTQYTVASVLATVDGTTLQFSLGGAPSSA